MLVLVLGWVGNRDQKNDVAVSILVSCIALESSLSKCLFPLRSFVLKCPSDQQVCPISGPKRLSLRHPPDMAIYARKCREHQVRVKSARALVDAQPVLLQARSLLCLDDPARECLNNPSGIVLREIEKTITEDDPETGLSVVFEEVQAVCEATQFMLAQAMPEGGSPQIVINTSGSVLGAHFTVWV